MRRTAVHLFEYANATPSVGMHFARERQCLHEVCLSNLHAAVGTSQHSMFWSSSAARESAAVALRCIQLGNTSVAMKCGKKGMCMRAAAAVNGHALVLNYPAL